MAAEHIRHCAGRGPVAAADAAWAASDALHAAAHATNNRALSRAADAYDRSARARFGRIPRRTGAGDRLRAAARMMALIGQSSGETPLAAVVLAANLVTLVLAVAELRQAQRHAAQASTARTAAEHLHVGARQMRAGTRAHTAQAARSSSVGYAASHDFPVPPLPGQAQQTSWESARASPLRRRQPPKRAGPAR